MKGLGSGEIHHIWPVDKALWMREQAERLEVPIERTAAVGDSAGDLAMLRAVGVQVLLPDNQRQPIACGGGGWASR